ncbi:hypothetical protein AB0M54_02440 [Actinoplanes sp. NPDC051470]|uniref:hypothetical protein n=1 Tax=Actinoplanes sp. NPDC051470 TaxID=3157224 RepID=UPI003423B7E2
MTNWMTTAGLALIAGGIATLIGFRHVLWGGGGVEARGERRRGGSTITVPAQIRARRRRQVLAALPAAPTRAAIEAPPAPIDVPRVPIELPREGKREGKRPGVPTGLPREAKREGKREGKRPGKDGPTHAVKGRFRPRNGVVDEPTSALAAMPAAEQSAPKQRPIREGDRIEGWVRPEYQDEEPASGDYWTPIPDESYGWPTPVERLPQAPVHPSRFDPIDEPEPTGSLRFGPVDQPEQPRVVPQWPPAQPAGRIELPRHWSTHNVQPRAVRRAGTEPGEPETPPRSRPRPRPRPSANTQPERSNVYRSRHAADPG